MAEVKVTKKDMFNEVIAMAKANDRQDIVEFAEREIELLNKRNSADSKAKVKKAEENAALADKVVEFLASADEGMAALPIASEVGVSTQKIAPILKALVNEGRITVTEEKRKKFYAIAQ